MKRLKMLGQRMGGENGTTRRRCQRIGFALALLLLPQLAHAHARPTSLTRVLLDPREPDRIIAVGTWGLASSDDAGVSWTWLCAAAYGVDPRFEDPPAALTADGRLLLATYVGLHEASGPTPCHVLRPPGRLGEGVVIDLATTRGGERAYAVLSELNDDDVLYRSTEVSGVWEEMHRNFDLLLDRVRVAPSDSNRVYVSAGQIRLASEPYRSFLLASEDGGRTFERFEFALEEGENLLLLNAVSPADPNVLFGQVVGFRGETALERIVRSDDAGRTWRTVMEAPDARSIAISEDGSLVFVGSTLGGLWRSTDGGANFSLVNETIHVRCLTWRGASLYVCTDPAIDGYGLGVSNDRGETFTPRLRFSEISGMATCPACTTAGFVCPAWSGDVIYDLELDAALPEGFDPDAGTGAPRDLGPPPPPCASPDLGSMGSIDGGTADGDASVPSDDDVSCRCGMNRCSRNGSLGAAIALLSLLVLGRRRGSIQDRPTEPRE